MEDSEKIELADKIIELVKRTQTSDEIPVLIGYLNKAQGINGFKLGEVGHPVFEFNQRYIIYLERNDGKLIVEIPYYKETLSPFIDFLNK